MRAHVRGPCRPLKIRRLIARTPPPPNNSTPRVRGDPTSPSPSRPPRGGGQRLASRARVPRGRRPSHARIFGQGSGRSIPRTDLDRTHRDCFCAVSSIPIRRFFAGRSPSRWKPAELADVRCTVRLIESSTIRLRAEFRETGMAGG